MKKLVGILAIALMLCAFSTANATLITQLTAADIDAMTWKATIDGRCADLGFNLNSVTVTPHSGGTPTRFAANLYDDDSSGWAEAKIGVTGSWSIDATDHVYALWLRNVNQSDWDYMVYAITNGGERNSAWMTLSPGFGATLSKDLAGDTTVSEIGFYVKGHMIGGQNPSQADAFFVQAAPVVPEPATLLLIGGGLLGLSGFRRKFKK